MEGLIIRKMTEKDIDEVLAIEREAFTTPWSRDAFVKEITENQLARYIVAEKDGQIVGFGGIWLILDEGHITNIAVAPNYRGQGIGNVLVKQLIKLCEELGIFRITLEVRRSNYIAQTLYKKHGFTECGIRPGYYADTKEDAIIMWKLK